MLLSGIYYGKTRIGRAYKNGKIIWCIGTDKYIDDVGVDIKSDIVAYVTAGALKILQLEENVRVYHSAFINASPIKPSEIAETVISTTNPILNVNTSSLMFVETGADIEGSAVIHTSPISCGNVDLDTSMDNESTIIIKAHRNDMVNETIDLKVIAEPVIDNSRNGTINETTVLDRDVSLNLTSSESGLVHETAVLDSIAKSHVDRTHNGLAKSDIVLQIETDLNRSPSEEELATETLLLQKDSILNISHDENGITNERINLNIVAKTCRIC